MSHINVNTFSRIFVRYWLRRCTVDQQNDEITDGIGKDVNGSGRGWFEVLPQIAPEWTDGISRIRRQVSRSSGRYLNPGPPDYEAVCYQLGCDIRRYDNSVKIWIGEGTQFESFP